MSLIAHLLRPLKTWYRTQHPCAMTLEFEAAGAIERDWGAVEAGEGDEAGLVEARELQGVARDFVLRKNEAIIGGLERNSFVFVGFEEGGGVLEILLFELAALRLDGAKLIERRSKLAVEALAMHAEGGDGSMGVDDVEFDARLLAGRIGAAVEERGFEERDAVLAPGDVGELVDEMSFGGGGGAILVEELLDVALVGGRVLSGEHGGCG